MMHNPFLATGPLNAPLKVDICQRIHYTALRLAARGLHPAAAPSSVPVTELGQRTRLLGPAAHLAHPVDVDRVFGGITTTVYRTIENLYCDRVGRSVRMVCRILDSMAQRAGVPAVDYEAVWAICLHLDERRRAETDVTVERTAATWRIARVAPPVHLQGMLRPVVVCVLDVDYPRVLAFRITDNERIDTDTSLAIYDAIVSQRRPSRDGAAGLIWPLPACLVSEPGLARGCRDACARVGINVGSTRAPSALLEALRGEWTDDLAGRTISQSRFVTLLDNYLDKVHGYGPIRARVWQAHDHTHLVGFNRDPAWQFPALRAFLAPHPAAIQEGGEIEWDGLHYEDPLLAYWGGREVALRRSPSSEVLVWVYVEDEVLCQAWARELRRQDGSYRANRPRR